MSKITMIVVALLASLLLAAGCGDSESSSSDSEETTTTTTTTSLTPEQVEGYFMADRSNRANRVEQGGTGTISVESVNCTIVTEGEAECVEQIRYQVGTLEKLDTTVWDVTYDPDTGEILAYVQSRNTSNGGVSNDLAAQAI